MREEEIVGNLKERTNAQEILNKKKEESRDSTKKEQHPSVSKTPNVSSYEPKASFP